MDDFNNRVNTLLKLSDTIQDEEKRSQLKRTLEKLNEALKSNAALEKMLSRFESELPKELGRTA